MRLTTAASLALLCAACATVPPPTWEPSSSQREKEYAPYNVLGTGTLTGQAFLAQVNGNVVKAAGQTVTLDPATSVGNEWWGKAGKHWIFRGLTPDSPGFASTRRSTTADAEGRFKFQDLPAGSYFVRTQVTWEVGGYYPTQGGLVGKQVQIEEGKTTEVILNKFP